MARPTAGRPGARRGVVGVFPLLVVAVTIAGLWCAVWYLNDKLPSDRLHDAAADADKREGRVGERGGKEFDCYDPSFCSGPTWDSIANTIRQYADIMADGTQDPTEECTGISIGIGFTLTASGLGQVIPYGSSQNCK